MPSIPISKTSKKWRREGWLSLSLRDFGFGFHLYFWRRKNAWGTSGFSVNCYLLFVDFHLEVWKTK